MGLPGMSQLSQVHLHYAAEGLRQTVKTQI